MPVDAIHNTGSADFSWGKLHNCFTEITALSAALTKVTFEMSKSNKL